MYFVFGFESYIAEAVSPSLVHDKTLQLFCMYSHDLQQSVDQPGKVANPARGQPNVIMPILSWVLTDFNRHRGTGIIA